MKVSKVSHEQRTVSFSEGITEIRIFVPEEGKPRIVFSQGFIEPGVRKIMNRFYSQAIAIIKRKK